MMKYPKPSKLKIYAFFGFLLLIVFTSLRMDAQEKPQLNKNYDKIIRTIASKYGLEASLIHSIIYAESNYDTYSISSKGAAGLMQLMPDTAKIYDVKNPFDPRENIEGGVRYLKDLIKLYDRRTDFVLAAYNAGQQAVKKYGGIPPYPETRNYIEKVRASYPKSTIRTRTKIYKYYDTSGKVVLTNSHYLYSLNKAREEANKHP